MYKSPTQLAKDFFALNEEISPFLVGRSLPEITLQAEYMSESELIELLAFLQGKGGKINEELARYEESGCENTSHFWFFVPFMKIHLGFMYKGRKDANLKAALEFLKWEK